MAIDFSTIDGADAQTGHVDFSAIGGVPAVDQGETTDETSALGAAGRGATGMIPLGEQAYAATAGAIENKPYLQERQELEKEIEADKANHGVARLAGQAAGLAAPALVTGGSSAPASLLEATGQGAAIGAGFGAGNAIDTLASGGSGTKAAGEVALGTLLGAGGGAAGQKAAHLLSKATPALEEFAAKKASQSAGLGADELGNMSQQEVLDTGKMLMDRQIVRPGASTQEMFDTAKAHFDTAGNAIGQIGNQAQELGLSTDTKPLLAALEDKYQAANALQNPDERKAALFYKQGMADILAMSRKNMPENLATVKGAPVPSDITFDQLQRLKRSYGNSAFRNGQVVNPAAADVYSQLSAGQKAIIATAKDNPSLPAELKTAMTDYSKLYPIVDGLKEVLGKERTGTVQPRAFGIVGKMAASLPGQQNPVINALTALGLVGAGHPLWGVGAFTATLNNPKVMASAAQDVAKAIPGVAEKLPTLAGQIVSKEAPGPTMHGMTEHAVEHGLHHSAEHAIRQNMGETKPVHDTTIPSPTSSAAPTTVNIDHPALAQWKPMFQKSAATAKNPGEVQKAHTMTDFILQQRDPAYAAASQKAKENPVSAEPFNSLPNETQHMADGGVIQEALDFSKPTPGFGSTLEGLESQMKNPTHEAPPPELNAPVRSTEKFHEPFNSDFADKLRAFLEDQKEKDNAEPR